MYTLRLWIICICYTLSLSLIGCAKEEIEETEALDVENSPSKADSNEYWSIPPTNWLPYATFDLTDNQEAIPRITKLVIKKDNTFYREVIESADKSPISQTGKFTYSLASGGQRSIRFYDGSDSNKYLDQYEYNMPLDLQTGTFKFQRNSRSASFTMKMASQAWCSLENDCELQNITTPQSSIQWTCSNQQCIANCTTPVLGIQCKNRCEIPSTWNPLLHLKEAEQLARKEIERFHSINNHPFYLVSISFDSQQAIAPDELSTEQFDWFYTFWTPIENASPDDLPGWIATVDVRAGRVITPYMDGYGAPTVNLMSVDEILLQCGQKTFSDVFAKHKASANPFSVSHGGLMYYASKKKPKYFVTDSNYESISFYSVN